jgi:hypothetical protein
MTENRAHGVQISTCTRIAEMFLLSLESSGWEVFPRVRTLTYVSGIDESAIDYWLTSTRVTVSEVHVGGSLTAQHRPVSIPATFQDFDGSFVPYF